jgi:DNA-binding MarR family transcriptional regulator/ribosomal protein S18 acetylase RimI-like enzyme
MDDIIKQLGFLALASRLRRLSERLSKDVSRIYKEQGIDFEARWFPVLYLLNEHSRISVTEAARALGLTHPAVNQIAGEMAKRKLVSSVKDKSDERRRLLSLTPGARRLVTRLEPIWKDVETAARQLNESVGTDILEAIEAIEQSLDERPMYGRIISLIKKRQYGAVEIMDYRPEYKKYFKSLNYEWLKEYFTVEHPDESMLSDPDGSILRKGGFIFFARLDGKVVGTTALLKHDDKTYEIAKMAVTKKLRGRQIGRKLADTAIARAAALGADTIMLETNANLFEAVSLYAKLGFAEAKKHTESEFRFKRSSISMELKLKDKTKEA